MPDTQSRTSLAETVFAFPARRPVVTLVISAVVLAVAAIGLAHIRINTSLQTMFPEDAPSATAMVRVLEQFPASNELILLASVSDTSQGEQPQKLLAFAERFERGLRNAPEGTKLTSGVIYRADPEFVEFSQRVLVPAGLYYLDDAAYAEAKRRLTPEGMAEQLSRSRDEMARPSVGGVLGKARAEDPLRLHEFFLSRLMGPRQFKTYDNNAAPPKPSASGKIDPASLPAFISPDGRAILIRVVGNQPPSNLDYCEELVKLVKATAMQANADGLNIEYTGAYAAADFSHHAIRADSIESIIASIVLLQLLFLIVYRRPFRQFLLELSPVLIGVFAGFCVYGWLRGGLSPVAAVIGGILAGMGIDYSVLYLAAYFRNLAVGMTPVKAVHATAVRTVGAMFAAWSTSAIGFIAIAWSSVPTLQDFALLGTMGLAGVFLAVVFVLPAVVVLWDTRRLARNDSAAARRLPFRWDVRPLLAAVSHHRRGLIVFSLIVFVVAAIVALTRPGGPAPLESDLHVMHPHPNPALNAEREIARRFGTEPGALIVHLAAESPEKLVELSYEVDRRLSRPEVQAAGISGNMGLSSFLPDPAVANQRKPFSPAEAERVVRDLESAMYDAGYASAYEAITDWAHLPPSASEWIQRLPGSYPQYAGFLRGALSLRLQPGSSELAAKAMPPPSVEALRPFPALWRSLLPSQAASGGPTPTEAITLVVVGRSTSERGAREEIVGAARQALSGLNGATLTGLPVISLDTESATRRDLPRLLGIAAVLVLVVLLLYYRSISRAALALLPLIFSLTVLAAICRITDTRLNLVNLVALPLLIGIDVDYGIYFVSMAGGKRRRSDRDAAANPVPPATARVAASAQAVITCAAASMLGFGSLITVSVPAVRSLGIVVAVGVIGSLLGTFALRAPILLKDEEQH
jgi:predicted RND superfamily exporter protein